jgi:hypothetical protein
MALSVQDAAIRDRLRPLVTPDLLARFRARPAAPYDPDIVDVLDFVRRNPDPECPRYLIVRGNGGFAVARRAPAAGAAPHVIDGSRHPDRAAAEYAVLLQRLRDYDLLA